MVYQPLLYLQVLIAGDLFSNISFRFSDFMKAAICVLSMPSQWIVEDFEVFQAMSLHTLSKEISLKSGIQFPFGYRRIPEMKKIKKYIYLILMEACLYMFSRESSWRESRYNMFLKFQNDPFIKGPS